MKTIISKTFLLTLVILVTASLVAAGDEGNPWLGFFGYMITGGPPSNSKPLATFSVNRSSGTPPLEVKFDADDSRDPDGTIESYSWVFGDGGTATGNEVTHTFADQGTHTTTLTVKDDEGAEDTFSQNISVTSDNQPPVASFEVDPKSGEVPLVVSFDASGSVDRDGSIASYEWEFGDGESGSGVTVDHTFDGSGIYNVKLTVTDMVGNENSETETVSAFPGVNYNTITDDRDGKTYKTVKIGSQRWFAENINYDTEKGDWCPSQCDTYGRFYLFKPAKNVCPSGWHLPSRQEWCTLLTHVDSTTSDYFCMNTRPRNRAITIGTDVGKKLKSTSGWYNGGNGTDAYGFNGLPAGQIIENMNVQKGAVAAWWTSTDKDYGETAVNISISSGSSKATVSFIDTSPSQPYYFSVRCIKDSSSSSD